MITTIDRDKIFNVSILVNVSPKDAAIIEQIWEQSENPHFTITKKEVEPLGVFGLVQLEIFAESTHDIWSLAKDVEFKQSQERFRPERLNAIQFEILINKYGTDNV